MKTFDQRSKKYNKQLKCSNQSGEIYIFFLNFLDILIKSILMTISSSKI